MPRPTHPPRLPGEPRSPHDIRSASPLPGSVGVAAAFFVVLVLTLVPAGCGPSAVHDVVIRGGTVYDGTGSPPTVADVAIDGDRITAVGDLSDADGRTEIDASGLAVSPGFINMLSWATESLILDGRSMSDIRQGVTLEVFGEGWSMGPLNEEMKTQALEDWMARLGSEKRVREVLGLGPDEELRVPWTTLGEYLEFLEEKGVSSNVASFVGATTVRIHELGYEDRPPTTEELNRMRELVWEAMEEGALGVGSSLIYAPAFYAGTDELIALSEVASVHGGLYISHIRSEGNRLLEAVDELMTISEEAGLPAEIYHLKAAGEENWPKLQEVFDRVEAARAEGRQITADVYTYTAGATGLDAAMPPWVQEGGYEKWAERLQDPETRRRVIREMRTPSDDWENLMLAAGPDGVLLVGFLNPELRQYIGMTLAEVAEERGQSAEETAIDLVVEDGSRVEAVYFLMSEENLKEKIARPWVAFCSDAGSLAVEEPFTDSSTHPRAYGSFARLLGKYVREEGVVPLEEAIRRLTSFPADNLSLIDRGRLAAGQYADVVVFDPETIADHATYEDPHQYATGVVHVFVNGARVLADGEHTGATPGRVVRGPGWTEPAGEETGEGEEPEPIDEGAQAGADEGPVGEPVDEEAEARSEGDGGAAAAALPAAVGEPEILWDSWGVPHVYAGDEEDLFFAYGWAQARAHADLILRLYGEARGRAAEYWGPDHLDSDRWVHTMGIPDGGRAWLEAQDPAFRPLLEAFADGVNAYARAHPEDVADDVERVLPVNAADILAHGQRVLLYTFVVDAGVVEGARRHLRSSAGRGSRPPALPGSNAWAIAPSRSASGDAMLLANPHLPWSGRFTWFEAQLVAPDVDVYGASLVGFPMIAIGFNDRLGWTHTVNTYDGADLYELELSGGGYRFGDEVRPFETDEVVLRVADGEGGFREEPLTVRRSVHGPVIASSGRRAVALRVAGTDAPGAARQWWRMGKARSLGEFREALESLQIPMFTVMYADRDGHVLHVFGGRVPVRPRGDWSTWSGLVSGSDPGLVWDRVHPFEDLPRLLDPATGWLQNANEPPWTTTLPMLLSPDDHPAYMAPPPSMHFRPQRSARMLLEDEEVTYDELLAYKHSTRMETADHFVDDVIAAAREHGEELAVEAADVLEAWDRTADTESRGAVLWSAFFDAWRRHAREAGTDELYAEPWTVDAPLATPDGVADPRLAAAALADAAEGVVDAHGALAVAWGDVHRLIGPGVDLPANGGPGVLGTFRVASYRPTDDGRRQAVGGDSFVAAVEFSDPVRARALVAYGNASQPASPHLGDQLGLFSRKELRPVWRERAEVVSHLELRETPLSGSE